MQLDFHSTGDYDRYMPTVPEIAVKAPFEAPPMPVVTEKGGPPAQKEGPRLLADWKEAIKRVFNKNKQMIYELAHPSYLDKEKIITELTVEGQPPPNHDAIEQELQRRIKHRQYLVSPEEVAKEEGFKGKSEDEVNKEVAKREKLRVAFDSLYTVESIENLPAEKIQNEINAAVAKLEEAAKAKDPPGAVTEAEKQAATDEIKKKYVGGDIYHRLDENGQPTEEFVLYSNSFKPIVTLLEEMAQEKDPSGALTDSAKEVQQSLDALQYKREENKFSVLSQEELDAKELKELGAKTSDLAIDILDAALSPHGTEILRIKKGKDKGKIDLEALRKIFPDGRYTHIAGLLINYSDLDHANHPDTDREKLETQRGYLSALLFNEIQALPESELPQQLVKRRNDLKLDGQELMTKNLNLLNIRSRAMISSITGIDIEKINLTNDSVYKCLSLAMSLKNHVGDVGGGKLGLDSKGQQIMSALLSSNEITANEQTYITALAANEKDLPKEFSDFLGFDPKVIESNKDIQKLAEDYSTKLVQLIEIRLSATGQSALTETQKRNYTTVSTEMIKDDVSQFADKRSWGKWLMAAGILAAFGLPHLQGIASETGDEKPQ